MKPFEYREHNRNAWNRLVVEGTAFASAATDADFENPLTSVDRNGWLGTSIVGQKVLCLAAGGGRHGPLYAAAGGTVTVVDISDAMLELDREVAAARRLSLRTIQGSMDELSMLDDAQFDIVIQPVSSCYIPDVEPMYREIARVSKANAVYISQHKQPTSLQASITPLGKHYSIVQSHLQSQPLPVCQTQNLVREKGTAEFAHSLAALVGGLCRAGFAVTDLIEPDHADPLAAAGTFAHRATFLKPYLRVRAVRTDQRNIVSGTPIWTPAEII